jgi:hypothetical protein
MAQARNAIFTEDSTLSERLPERPRVQADAGYHEPGTPRHLDGQSSCVAFLTIRSLGGPVVGLVGVVRGGVAGIDDNSAWTRFSRSSTSSGLSPASGPTSKYAAVTRRLLENAAATASSILHSGIIPCHNQRENDDGAKP